MARKRGVVDSEGICRLSAALGDVGKREEERLWAVAFSPAPGRMARVAPCIQERPAIMSGQRPFAFLVSLLALSTLAFVFPGRTVAQGLEEVKARYTKYEYRIPMRDG